MANDRNMINAFDDAIDRLSSGEDLEKILKDYPEYADHLRDLLMISERVSEVHNADDAVISAQSRGRDRLQQALQEKPKRAPRHRTRWYLTGAVATIAMIFGLGVLFAFMFPSISMGTVTPPLDMTRTAIAEVNEVGEALIGATIEQATVNANTTQVAQDITPLYINATSTPLPTQAPPTVTPPLAPFEMTATALVQSATDQFIATTQAFQPGSTMLDPFELTATALIQEITAIALATTQAFDPIPQTLEPQAIIPTSVASMQIVTATPIHTTNNLPFKLTAEAQPDMVARATELSSLYNVTPSPDANSGVEGGIKTTSMPFPSPTPMMTSTATGTPTSTPTPAPTQTPAYDVLGTPVADASGLLPTLASAQATELPALIPLTAGDIDDNADWDTYLRYRQEFLARNIPVRDIDVTGRQIITVVDEINRPILGANVDFYLNDELVHQSITYADGRTMFLPNTDSVTSVNDIYTVVVTKDNFSSQFTLDRRQSGQWYVTLPGAYNRDNVGLDVLFLIDTTSSMSDEIFQLQNNILHISSEVNDFADVDVRYGLVLYREHDNFEYLTRRTDFTPDVSEFQASLNTVTANSGDNNPDWDEALNVGLDEALQLMSWREGDTIKLIFLVADARPHLNHPLEPVPYDVSILNALERGIKIHPIASSGLEQAGEYIFRQIAQVTLGHFIFLTYDNSVVGTTGGSREEFNVGQPESEDPISGYTVNQLSDIVLKLIQDELSANQLNRP